MNAYPSKVGGSNAVTKKELWMSAFVAALHRVEPDEAVNVADQALKLADERWKDASYVGHWQYRHDFPVGHHFPDAG